MKTIKTIKVEAIGKMELPADHAWKVLKPHDDAITEEQYR